MKRASKLAFRARVRLCMTMRVRPLALLLLTQCTSPPLGKFATEWLSLTARPDSTAIVAFTRAHQGALPFTATELDSTVMDMMGFTGALGPLTPIRTISSTDSVLIVLVRTDSAGTWRALFRQATQPNHEQVIVEVSPAQQTPALPTAGIEVPLARAPSGRPIVMVSVNNSAPLRFVIDIGTNVSIITPDALRKILTADQATRATDIGRFVFDSLTLGGAVYHAGALRIDDLGSELDGLLGLDMFTELLLTLDYPGARVRLTADSLPSPDGRKVLGYSLPRPGTPTIPFTLDGKSYQGVLDVGSSAALSVPVPMVDSLRWVKPPVLGMRYSGPQLEDVRAKAGRSAGDAVIAGLTIKQPIVEGIEPAGAEILIGQPTLAAFSLSLDQVHRRVKLAVPGPHEVRPGSMVVPGFRLKPAGTAPVVDDVIPASGAFRAGLQVGDTVVAINAKPLAGMTPGDLRALVDRALSFAVDVIRRGAPHRFSFAPTRLVE